MDSGDKAFWLIFTSRYHKRPPLPSKFKSNINGPFHLWTPPTHPPDLTPKKNHGSRLNVLCLFRVCVKNLLPFVTCKLFVGLLLNSPICDGNYAIVVLLISPRVHPDIFRACCDHTKGANTITSRVSVLVDESWWSSSPNKNSTFISITNCRPLISPKNHQLILSLGLKSVNCL